MYSRVLGDFPATLTIDAPIYTHGHQLGKNYICNIEEGGKEAITKFEKLLYNGHTSVVKCMPLTGRMHQIRLHLQHAGKHLQSSS